MFLTHSLFNNGKSQSMDMPLRCVHALCPFMWYYGKGVVASCLGYNLALDSGSAACVLA